MMHIAVVGYGYWGPNIVRNFFRLKNVSVSWVADSDKKKLTTVSLLYPSVRTTSDLSDITRDPSVGAVVIVTPPATHFTLAKQFLLKGKHVLVEKPMTKNLGEAKQLVDLARRQKKILMVDHTFVYTPAVQFIRSSISSGLLGSVYYIDSVRTNLGLFQKDTNVITDLAVHDFSIMEYLFARAPKTLSAIGYTQKEIKQAAVAHITAQYQNGLFLHCHVSWLSPVKIRQMIFVGTKKMLVYNDIDPSEKIKIYDKGVSFTKDPKTELKLRIGYQSGTIVVPDIPIEEGLHGMAKEFINSISSGNPPITDGRMGLSVVQCLTKANQSFDAGGVPIQI